jgi:hypothetical protein
VRCLELKLCFLFCRGVLMSVARQTRAERKEHAALLETLSATLTSHRNTQAAQHQEVVDAARAGDVAALQQLITKYKLTDLNSVMDKVRCWCCVRGLAACSSVLCDGD